MASFAQKQLEKYGWKQGQGLGKKESGILKPIKPSLKFDSTGVGYDHGEEFTYHWWEHMYNKASNSLQVQSKDDEVSVKKVGDGITKRSSRKLAKTFDNRETLYGHFLKTATLTDGKMIGEEGAEEINKECDKDEPLRLSDEELFRKCGGRTAHKAARHGLKLNGKLQRLEQQDKEFFHQVTKIKPTDKDLVLKDNDLREEVELNVHVPSLNNETYSKCSEKRGSDFNPEMNEIYIDKRIKKKHKKARYEVSGTLARNSESFKDTLHSKKKRKHKRKVNS